MRSHVSCLMLFVASIIYLLLYKLRNGWYMSFLTLTEVLTILRNMNLIVAAYSCIRNKNRPFHLMEILKMNVHNAWDEILHINHFVLNAFLNLFNVYFLCDFPEELIYDYHLLRCNAKTLIIIRVFCSNSTALKRSIESGKSFQFKFVKVISISIEHQRRVSAMDVLE